MSNSWNNRSVASRGWQPACPSATPPISQVVREKRSRTKRAWTPTYALALAAACEQGFQEKALEPLGNGVPRSARVLPMDAGSGQNGPSTFRIG